jgi:LCP family protein required for cell wall assembly
MSPDAGERPPREGLRFLLRAGLALILIVLLTAGATATAGLLEIKDTITPPKNAPPVIQTLEVTEAKPGAPQTIMILGSDRRWSDLKQNNPALTRSNPARSDTILLVRMDPKRNVIAVLSIPRDLKVLIPGHGIDKINAAYSLGGASLTAKTVKQLLGIKINHIVNINFRGFRQAVDAVGCLYIDVDRRYYHSNLGLPVSQRYAEIDVHSGYQKLCGQRALDYARFRHADSDIVRAARQQDVLRSAKDQISTSSLINDRTELIKIFQRNTQTDKSLRSVKGVLKLAKLSLYSAGNPVTQIQFPATFTGDAKTGSFVEASPDAIQRVAYRFMHAAPTKHKTTQRKLTPRGKTTRLSARLVNARRAGEDLVASTVASHRLGFPLYFPKRLTPEGHYASFDSERQPFVYTIRDRAGRPHRAYRLTVVQNELEGQYYGIQGMSWMNPPLIAHPDGTRVIAGRRLMLFKDGSHLQFVAWKRKRALYWVSNSLSLSLTNSQMLGIASSLMRLR